MGIFNFFKRKKSTPSSSQSTNPTDVFNQMGEVMGSLWHSFIVGQNRAVDVYSDYKNFVSGLEARLPNVDFDRRIVPFEEKSSDFVLTSGECMYLYALRIRASIYIASDEECTTVLCINEDDINSLRRKLTSQEIEYSHALGRYIAGNIKPLVDEVSTKLYGITLTKHPIPVHSLKCVEYHRYLAGFPLLNPDTDTRRWNRIVGAPIIDYWSKEENPVVPIGIQYLDVSVRDWLCYATICLPSADMDRVLYRKVEEAGKRPIDVIIQTFGTGIDKFIETTISDMNGQVFRDYVRTGLKIK